MSKMILFGIGIMLAPIIAHGQPFALEGTQPNEKLGKIIRIAALGVQIACEVTKCTEQAPQAASGRAESQRYPAPGTYPTDVQPTYEDGGGPGSVYGFAPSRSVLTPQARNSASQQDQPSGTIRSKVQWVVSRIRQLGGTVRGIRFRKVAPWRWECDITFRFRGSASDSYCRVRADGTIEGI